MTYAEMLALVEEAEGSLERLRVELDDRVDDEIMDERPEELDEGTAAAAVIALSNVFEVVKALAADGQPLTLPTAPLALPDAVLVTILANAEVARRGMLADLEWVTQRLERVGAQEPQG